MIAVAEHTERNKPIDRLGFITIVDVPELGFAGGMLVVSPAGRPIEFHCTPPVAENRTQKILYGQTYRGFLFCDQIASSLVEKSKSRPQLLVTDRRALLPLDKIANMPVVMLQSHWDGETDPDGDNSGQDNRAQNRVSGFDVGGEKVFSYIDDASVLQWVKSACFEFTRALPLVEPFERIQLAIEEAQSVAR